MWTITLPFTSGEFSAFICGGLIFGFFAAAIAYLRLTSASEARESALVMQKTRLRRERDDALAAADALRTKLDAAPIDPLAAVEPAPTGELVLSKARSLPRQTVVFPPAPVTQVFSKNPDRTLLLSE